MAAYVGQTVVFDAPMFVTNNYSSTLTISPRRIVSPTNQAYPRTAEYNSVVALNNNGMMSLSGVSGYHRMGERIFDLTVRVNSQNSLTWKSGTFRGNTRADLEKGIPNIDLTEDGREHRLLVCAMNLEYYLVDNLGTGYGPDNASQHARQRSKISKALAKIEADIYGLMEIEQGQSALEEIAADLTENTGHTYAHINDGGSANGSYTKSGYVYRTDKVEPYGQLYNNEEKVLNRKKIQCFEEKETGERFFFSINHFKAKSGSGTGQDADQGDGQGIFNYTRTCEAKSVIAQYTRLRIPFREENILIMGDLNAYAKEDPIRAFTTAGMIDLHRAFHADSSYSYTFRGQIGYLDHAICDATLFPQITGMAAYHINSDESDDYTYDKSWDETMFRSSDHDPILVGLALDHTLTSTPELGVNTYNVFYNSERIRISNGRLTDSKSFYYLYTTQGTLIDHGEILDNEYSVASPLPGMYVLIIYAEGNTYQYKIIIS